MIKNKIFCNKHKSKKAIIKFFDDDTYGCYTCADAKALEDWYNQNSLDQIGNKLEEE